MKLTNAICSKTGKEHREFKKPDDASYRTMENVCCVDCGMPECVMYGAVAVPVEAIDWNSAKVVTMLDEDGNVLDTEMPN